MKVRLLVSRAGVDFSQAAGEEIEVSAKEGKSLIDAGQAEAVSGAGAAKGKKAPAKETATKKVAAETRD